MAIGLYGGLISMVAMGVGTLTRSSAATVTMLFLLLLVASALLGGLGASLGWDWLIGWAAAALLAGAVALTTKPKAATIPALPSSNRVRAGTHCSEKVIERVAYSEVISSIAGTE